jgi:hypothetical protein
VQLKWGMLCVPPSKERLGLHTDGVIILLCPWEGHQPTKVSSESSAFFICLIYYYYCMGFFGAGDGSQHGRQACTPESHPDLVPSVCSWTSSEDFARGHEVASGRSGAQKSHSDPDWRSDSLHLEESLILLGLPRNSETGAHAADQCSLLGTLGLNSEHHCFSELPW